MARTLLTTQYTYTQTHTLMSLWYDCLLLKNRTLTEHEKKNLSLVKMQCVSSPGLETKTMMAAP